MLSEVVGTDALPLDKFNLAMGMEYWANKTLQKMRDMYENGTIKFIPNLDRYVDGINYYLNTHKHEKPLEYYIIGFEPTEWSALDSLCLVQEMARQMSWNYRDFYRYQNFEAFGPINYSEIFSLPTPYQIPICPDYGEYDAPPGGFWTGYTPNPSLSTAITNFLAGVEKIDSHKDLIESQNGDSIGSNNWVVNGSLSTTGKPILCNDMHLSWILPGVWYEQHLKCESGLNVYGFAIPGMPLAAVGYNEYVGWGFTNTGYDVIDWYYYNKDPNNLDTKYIYNGAPTDYTTRTHEIKVKGEEPVEFTVKQTVHGPVLSDLRDFGLPESFGDIVIAPQWTANDYYFNFLAGDGFDRAHNRSAFNEASKYWDTLAQNIVYGDIYGNIAIRPTGKVPIRDDTRNPSWHLGNGTFPYNGSNGEGEWIGYVPFDDLPLSLNPEQSYFSSTSLV